jgi:hypothetical protein
MVVFISGFGQDSGGSPRIDKDGHTDVDWKVTQGRCPCAVQGKGGGVLLLHVERDERVAPAGAQCLRGTEQGPGDPLRDAGRGIWTRLDKVIVVVFMKSGPATTRLCRQK